MVRRFLRWCTAGLFAVASGCGASSPPHSPAGADAVRMTRVEVCYQIASEVCQARGHCSYTHIDGEYACRDRVMHACCRDEQTCAQPVLIRWSRMSECLRGIERNMECDRLFTPACNAVIPEPSASIGSMTGRERSAGGSARRDRGGDPASAAGWRSEVRAASSATPERRTAAEPRGPARVSPGT